MGEEQNEVLTYTELSTFLKMAAIGGFLNFLIFAGSFIYGVIEGLFYTI